MARILVTGASSMVGDYLLPSLREFGHGVIAVSRRSYAEQAGIVWRQADVARTSLAGIVPEGCDVLIHLAPLPLLPHMQIALPAGITRMVAIGTTSVFTKSSSGSEKDRRLVQHQRQAEKSVRTWCREHSIVLTLLRPTLVYDGRRDKNVARIARLIHRVGFFPLAAPGHGLRQPLHAADLAAACNAALQTHGSQAYNLAGGETLSYRTMVERIFQAMGRQPRIVTVPLILYRSAIATARILPRYRQLTPEVADRMNQDMVFDYSNAARDLDFRPRGFAPDIST